MNSLAEQIFAGGNRGRKMEIGNMRNQNAIDLFRKGMMFITASEASLDMADGNFLIKALQRNRKSRCRVALNEHHIRSHHF